jgi:3-dehydroquinate dehydratase/shikimate dehydrogenase
MTHICATVIGKDVEAIRRARAAVEADADLVELRLDSMDRPDPAATLADRRKPTIVTCRPLREGGMFDGAEEERLRILRDAQALGAEFVDVEWDADARSLIESKSGAGVIVSRHVFDGMPRDVPAMLDRLRATGGEVAKLAVMIERVSDLAGLLDNAGGAGSTVLIGMGRTGVATRVLAGRFGSRWTYAGTSVAPGQLPITQLLGEYRFRRVQSDAAVFAVLGRPVLHSLSPAMHNAGFAALGLNAVYVPLETRDLGGLRAFGERIGLGGVSVTIPFKRDVMPLLDELAPTAAAAGAVNTIVIRDGQWIGMNTDADGFIEPLRRRLPAGMSGLRAVVLGSGGAARGVALALRREGARVAICARRPDRAREAADTVGAETVDWPASAGSWDVLVNATPVGSRAVPGRPYDAAFDGRVVYDLVYDPDPTELMMAAREADVETIGGIEMLVGQAERQFEIWTGQRPPAGLFAQAAADAGRDRRQSERRSASAMERGGAGL